MAQKVLGWWEVEVRWTEKARDLLVGSGQADYAGRLMPYLLQLVQHDGIVRLVLEDTDGAACQCEQRWLLPCLPWLVQRDLQLGRHVQLVLEHLAGEVACELR